MVDSWMTTCIIYWLIYMLNYMLVGYSSRTIIGCFPMTIFGLTNNIIVIRTIINWDFIANKKRWIEGYASNLIKCKNVRFLSLHMRCFWRKLVTSFYNWKIKIYNWKASSSRTWLGYKFLQTNDERWSTCWIL